MRHLDNPTRNITYKMTNKVIYRFPNEEITIKKSLHFFRDVHMMFAGDASIIEHMADKCILGEAYLNACMNWNKGITENNTLPLIPGTRLFYNELRKLLVRYAKRGCFVSESWRKAIRDPEEMIIEM